MDIQPPAVSYDDDICISRLLSNSHNDEDDDDETLMQDENFALELQLQEAMLKSFKKPTEEIGDSSKKVLCEICAEIKGSDYMFRIEECRHDGYCKDCISKHVEIEVRKRRRVITCPGVGCTSVLEIGTCGEMVAPDVRRVWEERSRESGGGGGGGDEREEGDLMLHDLAKEKKWQICPNCNVYVDKMEGCLHMTCRCQFEFCYACGVAWSSTHGGCQ